MQTLEAIGKRCSLRTHLCDKPVEQEKIDIVLEAARLAPSARNTQPWRFVVVQGAEAVSELVRGAFMGPGSILELAPVIIVACARPEDDVTHDEKPYYLFDMGLAMENIFLAATDLGLVTHPMAAFREAEVKRILQIPDDVRVVLVTPLGYPQEASYDEAAAERLGRRTRKELREIAFSGRWGA
jgi:nitroreductase